MPSPLLKTEVSQVQQYLPAIENTETRVQMLWTIMCCLNGSGPANERNAIARLEDWLMACPQMESGVGSQSRNRVEVLELEITACSRTQEITMGLMDE